MHQALEKLVHRPWPIPKGPWMWRQTWSDLLFLHWPTDSAKLRPHVPAELDIQEFDGSSWIGLVPFRMSGVSHRPIPDVPWVSVFPELNLRVYVEKDGKPGVYFFSLDAGNPLAVLVAKKFFHLPYHHAEMRLEDDGEYINYYSSRYKGAERFLARYRPIGPVEEAKEGTLDHWLTERYCLYAKTSKGKLYRHEIHHHPWPLQKAEVEIQENTFMQAWDIEEAPSLVHFARQVDVVMWPRDGLGIER